MQWAVLLALAVAATSEANDGDGSVFVQTRLASQGSIDLMPTTQMMAKARLQKEMLASQSVRMAQLRALQHDQPESLDEPYRQVMVNFGDAQYIGYFTVGHQLVGGIIDTGSYELVVFSSVCPSCGAAAQYNPWLSSSYTVGAVKTTHSFGSGDIFSEQAFDEVSIGPFPDTNQYFWEVTKANMPILYNAAFQAIIGIGPPETPASDAWESTNKAAANVSLSLKANDSASSELLDAVTSNLEMAMEMSSHTPLLSTVNVSMFSMCVGKKPGSDGYFIWNDYSALKYPRSFKRVPVVGKHTWSVWLDNVRIPGLDEAGNTNATGFVDLGCTQGCSAIIDSGTSLLAVPGFIKSKLESVMDRMDSNCSNLHELPDLLFNLGGHTFALPPDAYVSEVVGAVPNFLAGRGNIQPLGFPYQPHGKCKLTLMESFASTAHGPLWILGLPFFRKYYTTFNIGKSKDDRALLIAEADRDCRPVVSQPALYSLGSRVHVRGQSEDLHKETSLPRKLDPLRLRVPYAALPEARGKIVRL